LAKACKAPHQLVAAVEHLVDQGVGQLAGALAGKQVEAGIGQALEHGAAQGQHAAIGHVGQGVFGNEGGQAAHRKQADQAQGDQPEGELPAGKALVEQELEQGGDGRLGQGTQQGAQKRQRQTPARALEERPQARKALPQRRQGRDGAAGGARWGGTFWIHSDTDRQQASGIIDRLPLRPFFSRSPA